MTVEVRRAVARDADILGRIAIAAYAKYIPRMIKAPAPVLYNYEDVINEGHTWVLTVDDRIGGMVTLVPKVDHILFRNLAVAPDSQGRGLGHRAMELAEREAERLGKPEIRLWTNVHMPENIPFYARAGFVETHRGDVDGYSFVYMAKRVRPVDGTSFWSGLTAMRACP